MISRSAYFPENFIFFWINKILWYLSTTFPLSIHLPMGIKAGSKFLAIVNRAIENMNVQVPLRWDTELFGCAKNGKAWYRWSFYF